MLHKSSCKRRRGTVRGAAAHCIEPLETRLLLSTVSWIAAGSGSWSTATDWSTNTVPQRPADRRYDQQVGKHPGHPHRHASVHSISVTGDTLSAYRAAPSRSRPALLPDQRLGQIAPEQRDADAGNRGVTDQRRLDHRQSAEQPLKMSAAAYSQTSNGSLTLPSGTTTTGVATNLLSNPGFESPSAGNSTTDMPSKIGETGGRHTSAPNSLTPGSNLCRSPENSRLPA